MRRTKAFAFGWLVGGALVLAVMGPVFAAPNVQEGEWESAVEMKLEMLGMPFAMPPMSFMNTPYLTG